MTNDTTVESGPTVRRKSAHSAHPLKIDRLVRAVEIGLPMTAAAAAAGIPRRTVYRWLSLGRSEEDSDPDCPEEEWSTYRQVYVQVEEARARCQAVHLANIARAGRSDWRASAWLLSRRFAEKYTERVIHTTEQPSVIDYRDLGIAELEAIAGDDDDTEGGDDE